MLLVGRIARAHGLKGEVGVVLVGDDPGRLAPGGELWLTVPGGPARAVRVLSRRGHEGRILLRLEGVDSREEAERLAGGELSVRFDPHDLGPGEYYPHQLEGLEVRDPEATVLGRVVAVVFGPGRPLLEVSLADRRGTQFVPFHPDIVKGVDLAAGRVTIDPPAGLLDL
ncbi:MAG: 16S rRNA processing protein RimM [Gemmatimonadetes bacterium]|nr:16S rRNA processing protein RimM [Gemmatimonadota bacterium]